MMTDRIYKTMSGLFALLLAGLLVLPSNEAVGKQGLAETNGKHPSELAALKCVGQIAPIFADRSRTGKDVACDIPVQLSEKDLDTVLGAAVKAALKDEKWQDYAQKYSGIITKAVTNFRAADCMIQIRARRTDIVDALERDQFTLQLDDQPVTCSILTRKRKRQPLSFAFTPRVKMQNGCIKEFKLNMGKIDAGCKVCFINRLYISTKLVSLWANHVAGNIRMELNRSLAKSSGKACPR